MALAALLAQQEQVSAFVKAQTSLLPAEQIGACVTQQCSLLAGMIERSPLTLQEATELNGALQSSGTFNQRQLQILGISIGKSVAGLQSDAARNYTRRPMQQVQFFHHYLSKKDVVALGSDAGHASHVFDVILHRDSCFMVPS